MKTATYASIGALLAISLTVASAHSYLQPDTKTLKSAISTSEATMLGTVLEPALSPEPLPTTQQIAAKPTQPAAITAPANETAAQPILAVLPRAKTPLYTGAVKKKAPKRKHVVQQKMPKAQLDKPGIKYAAVNKKRSGPKKRLTLRKDIWASGIYR